MESQPRNPELRNNPENFHTCYCEKETSYPENLHSCMRGSRIFCMRGPTLAFFFCLDEGRKDPNSTKSGALNGVSLAGG